MPVIPVSAHSEDDVQVGWCASRPDRSSVLPGAHDTAQFLDYEYSSLDSRSNVVQFWLLLMLIPPSYQKAAFPLHSLPAGRV